MEKHDHSDELELGILKEVNELFPHRKVIIQIGKDFSRKDIAEKLTPYGEVRMGCHKSGNFYEQQVELGIQLSFRDDTEDNNDSEREDRKREAFDLITDQSIRITITENDKVAGMIVLLIENTAVTDSRRKEKLRTLSEEEKRRERISWKLDDEITNIFNLKLRSQPRVTSTSFIVHSDFRNQKVGVHLHLLRFFCCWFFSAEFTGISLDPTTKGILKTIGAEVLDKQVDFAEFLATYGHSPPNALMYLFYSEYSKRELYYQNVLNIMNNKSSPSQWKSHL